jgi:hypothetical protein
MSTPDLPDHPTRQQLDELDALMARMLALPVKHPEESLSPPRHLGPTLAKAESGQPESHATPEAAREISAENKFPGMPGFQNIIVASPEASRITNDISLAAPLPPLPADYPTLELSTAVSMDRRTSAAVFSPRLTGPESRSLPDRHAGVLVPARISFWPRPVAGCNRVYDSVTAKLGRPGAWLRETRGRTFVGLTGIGLLMVALGWVLIDSLGWTW